MFSILFCLVSLTRTTIVYLSRQLFPNLMDRLMLPESEDEDFERNLDTMEEWDVLRQDHPSTSGSRNVLKRSHERNVTDAGVMNPMEYEEEEERHVPRQIIKLPVRRTDTNYNMRHEERGKCVVFSHDEFDLGVAPPRKGSKADVDAIERAFGKLGFTVEKHFNYSHQDIQATIEDLVKDNHGNRDCICIFMLTHGTTHGLIYARDCPYPSLEIWKPFTASNCDTLVGKPKLFFFQACRGSGLESGITVYSTTTSETDSVVSASYKIPTHADFLLAYSTTEGFYSWRDTEEGTWYIQCLCKVVEKYWTEMDLSKMLTITARIIANDYSSSHIDPRKDNQKQMPSLTSTLTRDVIFIPKNNS